MKTVAIIHKDSPEIGTFPPMYAEAYANVARHGAEEGLRFCEASAYDWDGAAGRFSRVRLDGKTVENFRPDAVWHKNSGLHHFTLAIEAAYGKASVNPMSLVSLARDKWMTYLRFKDLMPRTALLSSALSEPSLLEGFPGEKVVVKPRTGHGGKGVRSVAKEGFSAAVADLAAEAESYVVQAWTDSSGGIPGVADGVHDLRTVLVSGEISHFSVRTPGAGDFRCNVSAGGSERGFPGDFPMPAEALELVRTVARAAGSGIYSVDCCRSGGRFLLGEINSAASVLAMGDPAVNDRYHRRICRHFSSVIR